MGELGKTQIIGEEILLPAAKEISKRLEDGASRGYKQDFLREVEDLGLEDMEKKYTEYISGKEKELEAHEAELERIYRKQTKSEPAEKLYNLQKYRTKFELMDEAELEGEIHKVHQGKTELVDVDEVEEFLQSVKKRAPKNFPATKAAFVRGDYTRPWLRLDGEDSKLFKQALKERKPGEYFTFIESKENPGAKAFLRRPLGELVKKEREGFKRNPQAEREERLMAQFRRKG